MRPGPERWSSSALSRSNASWVSQVTVSSRVSVTGTPRYCAGRTVRGTTVGPPGVISLRLTSVGDYRLLVKWEHRINCAGTGNVAQPNGCFGHRRSDEGDHWWIATPASSG